MTIDGAMSSAGTAVILFTDIVASTALTERMGDARFRDASRALDAGLRAAIRDAGGAAIDGKLLGDGVLATFPSAAQAIDGARRCLALSAASELGLHIGLHAGDVIREDNNVYGGAVNIASRICGLSAPGEILVSDVVRGMARSSAGVEFEDRGEQEMKGVGEPVRVYAVRDGRCVMDPQIRYVRSFDGTRIAYATTGSDSEIPIVCAPNPDGLVSIEVESEDPPSTGGDRDASRSRIASSESTREAAVTPITMSMTGRSDAMSLT